MTGSLSGVSPAYLYGVTERRLDLVLAYLRRVHLVSYYAHTRYRDEGAMLHSSATPFLRHPLPRKLPPPPPEDAPELKLWDAASAYQTSNQFDLLTKPFSSQFVTGKAPR